jgi:hypothetical protein
MRVLMIVKASPESEAGVMPGEALLAAMAKYNEELMEAGVLLDRSGLHPSSKGARVTFSGGKRTVTEGPFPDPKDLIAGYWIINVKSRDDAIEWAKRVSFDVDPKGEAQIEIRQLFELDDFAPSEAIEQHRKLDQELARKK